MTLANSQKNLTLTPVYKIVLTGASTYTYEKDRILDIEFHEEPDTQTAKVLLDNSDGSLTAIDFSGYGGVISLGVCIDSVDTYQARPPQKVISQDFYSGMGVGLVCQLYLIGIPDRLEADKASKDYYHHYSDTKTVRALFSEVLSGVAVTSEITDSQESADTDLTLKDSYWGGGQRITLVAKTVTKVSFRLKKVGSPTGNITFYIRATDDLTILESKVWADASTLTTSYAWCEVTLDTPTEITEEVYIYAGYEGGAGSDYVMLEYQASDLKDGSCLVLLEASGADPWTLFAGYDCAFKYKYNADGVDCFAHCEAYTVSYDSALVALDPLLDSYLPKDSLVIRQGDSRLSVANKLLDYTTCRKRVEDDGVIHVFVPYSR